MSWLLPVRLLVLFLLLLPLMWIIRGAFLPQGVALGEMPAFFTLNNFRRIFTLVPLWQYTLNSLLVAGIGTMLSLLIGSWAGFGMAQLPHPAQRRWLFLSLALLMVPSLALWTSRFWLFRWLGWLDSWWALIAVGWMGGSPFYVLMFYRAFRRMPAFMLDAARIDGAGVLQSWWLVALPTIRPTVLGVAILCFAFFWGDINSPLLYLRRQSLSTLPVALQLLQQMSRSDWSLMLAAVVWVLLVPIMLLVFGMLLWRLWEK